MAVKMRLQRKGRRKQPYYHIVVADARAKRDGKYIDRLGSYNPMTSPATIEIDEKKAFDWLSKGAQPTDTVRAILRFKGVLYLKHLLRGVRKEAFTEEQAWKMWHEWKDSKNEKVAERFEATAKAKEDYLARVFGEVPKIEELVKEVKEAAETTAEAVAEEVEAQAEAAEAVAADVVEEVAAEVEKVAEPVAEETAKVEEAVTGAVEDVSEAVEAAVEAVEEKVEEVPTEGQDKE